MFVTTIKDCLSYLHFPSEWRFQMNSGHTLIKNENGHGSLFTFVILISHYYTYHYNSKWEQFLIIPFTEVHESSSQDKDYTAVTHMLLNRPIIIISKRLRYLQFTKELNL